MDANEADFQDKVIDRSRQVPVVVDFWAPWCGPCRTLGPVLEKAVAQLGGRVELVKVNTDENANLARRFRIQGIPRVLAFKDGEVIDEFTGAQPPEMVRAFLSTLAPSEEELAEEAALSQASAHLAAGRLAEVTPLLDKIHPRSPRIDRVEAIRRLLELAQVSEAYGGEARAREKLASDEKDLEARYALGAALAGRGELREALEQFLEIVTRSRKFRDDGGRRAMVTLFELPSIDPELAREFRRRLQIVT